MKRLLIPTLLASAFAFGTLHSVAAPPAPGGPSTTPYYASNPGSADTLVLDSTPVIQGTTATWTVTNATPGATYALVYATRPNDNRFLAGGEATLLVSGKSRYFKGAAFMGNGSLTVNLPPVVPSPMYTQAMEFVNSMQPGNVVAASNGLKHVQ